MHYFLSCINVFCYANDLTYPVHISDKNIECMDLIVFYMIKNCVNSLLITD